MAARMKLKTLQGHLQELKGFSEPKVQLEQYVTPAHIAAVALYTIQTQYQSIEDKLVLDAGCGPGALSIGAALLGAGAVIALDVDEAALQDLRDNIEYMEVTNVEVMQCDFLTGDYCRAPHQFDTVLMNPPFGTKHNAGADVAFLAAGLKLASDCVYSLHKTSTRKHIQKKAKEWGVDGSVIAELRYDLPATYKFHKQQSRDIAVDLWRLQHKS